MDIDSLGEGKIELLYDKGLVKNVADLYDLTFEDLIGLEKTYTIEDEDKTRKVSFREKTVENILNGLEKSKIVPFERVLFALGIRFVGETVAKRLAMHFGSIDRIKAATKEDLIAVDEVGEKIAESVIQFFSDEKNRDIIYRLKEQGLQMESEQRDNPSGTPGKLQGKSFVVSGIFTHFTRDELKKKIEESGGKNVSSISSKTDYLIAGENMGPAKKQKAHELGVPIITEDDFLALIQ
jgi:DNA ligase (NAD+)